MTKESLVYLISPVRQVTPEQAQKIADHAARLKRDGVRLFNPVEDAPQDDETGFNIVMSELGFMHKALKEGGRVDILWNAGGTPSEGSRVDLGMAIVLGLEFNLVDVFNEDQTSGSQLGLQIIKEVMTQDLRNSPRFNELLTMIDEIRASETVIIDWDVEMLLEEQEWQRIRLGLALGWMAVNPNLKIKMGKLVGEDPADKKSYVKVVKEIERRQKESILLV
jgi:hypothetical protein